MSAPAGKMSAEAVKASIGASSSRERAVQMCRASDSMPTVGLSKLLGIRALALLHTWAAETARYRAHVLGRAINIKASNMLFGLSRMTIIRAPTTSVRAVVRPLLSHWLQQTYAPAMQITWCPKLGNVLKKHALWIGHAAKYKMEAMLTVWRRQARDAHAAQVESAVDTTSVAVDTTESRIDSEQLEVDTITGSASIKTIPASSNVTATEVPPSVKPAGGDLPG